MPPSFEVDTDPIYVFEVDETYLFAEYFEHEDLFAELRDYYNDDQYRFEVPESEFDDVRELLDDYFYEPVLVDEIEAFCVVKEQYTEHADILRNAVEHWSRDDHLFFLMKDPLAVDQAVEEGAQRVAETDFAVGL